MRNQKMQGECSFWKWIKSSNLPILFVGELHQLINFIRFGWSTINLPCKKVKNILMCDIKKNFFVLPFFLFFWT